MAFQTLFAGIEIAADFTVHRSRMIFHMRCEICFGLEYFKTVWNWTLEVLFGVVVVSVSGSQSRSRESCIATCNVAPVGPFPKI